MRPYHCAIETAGKVLEKIEGFGQHMAFRHGFQSRHIQAREDAAQGFGGWRCLAGKCDICIARIQQHHAAVFHIGIELFGSLS